MKCLIVLLLVILLAACTYYPPFDGVEDDNATYMPPNLPPQPTLPYPSLPWNHPCNDPNVIQLPGACP